MADAAKGTIAETWENDGDLGNFIGAIATGVTGCAASVTYCFTPTKFVSSITVATTGAVPGEITVTYDTTTTGIAAVSGANTIHIVPTIGGAALAAGSKGNIDWHCLSAGSTFGIGTKGSVQARYAPAQCRAKV